MKKLLLTSDGFKNPNIGKRFLELADKYPKDIKVLFIATASQTEEEMSYVYESEKELIDLGITREHIVWADSLENIETQDYDAMYVCGGNTFHLLNEVRKTGFDKKIVEFVNSGKLYVGVSAGSIIACPSILTAKNGDQNKVGITDLTGLGFVQDVITPHYNEKEEEIIKKFEQESNYKILRLPDGQALEVLGNLEKIII
jgi:dipeptidase E